jgi:transposase InsO family protein
MNAHKNARLTPHGRSLLVCRVREQGWRVADAAMAAGIAVRTAYRWLARFRAGGAAALNNRRATPARSPSRLPDVTVQRVLELRRQRMTGPKIARELGLKRSTTSLILRRHGLGRLSALDQKPPIVRYQRQWPGELLHLDTKKLGRIARVGHRITGDRHGQSNSRGIGWEYLHVAVDDASRLAYTEILPSERKEDATNFLQRALTWFGRYGVTVERVMTDNGSAYRSQLFRQALSDRGIAHKRTRPYTPRTNGKAERFIQTSLREWAYARPYQTSAERTHAMQPWVRSYNHARPHSALDGHPPFKKLTNVLGFDT